MRPLLFLVIVAALAVLSASAARLIVDAGTLQVESFEADEVRTGDIYFPPECKGLTFAEENIVLGDGGSDTVRASRASFIATGGGDDTIYGSPEADCIFAGGGDDTVHGGGGNDIIFGGEGEDAIFGAKGSDDEVHGGPDEDLCLSGAGSTYSRCEQKAIKGCDAHEDADSGAVALTWEKIKHAAGYAIYRSLDNRTFQKIGTVQGTSYTDRTIEFDTTYFYAVSALFGDDLESDRCQAVRARVSPPSPEPEASGTPAAPAGGP